LRKGIVNTEKESPTKDSTERAGPEEMKKAASSGSLSARGFEWGEWGVD